MDRNATRFKRVVFIRPVSLSIISLLLYILLILEAILKCSFANSKYQNGGFFCWCFHVRGICLPHHSYRPR